MRDDAAGLLFGDLGHVTGVVLRLIDDEKGSVQATCPEHGPVGSVWTATNDEESGRQAVMRACEEAREHDVSEHDVYRTQEEYLRLLGMSEDVAEGWE